MVEMNRRDAKGEDFASIQEGVRIEMSIWQMSVLFAAAGCALGALGCLLGIWRTLAKVAKGIFCIGAELTKLNAKIEGIEAVKTDDSRKQIDQLRPDPSLEDIEAALSNLEKLKRIDLTNS